MNPVFFKDLNFNFDYFDEGNQKLNHRSIKRAIKFVCQNNKDFYPKLNPNMNGLKFDSRLTFAKSYLLMIRNMDMTKVQR
jgi:hypothetical protein